MSAFGGAEGPPGVIAPLGRKGRQDDPVFSRFTDDVRTCAAVAAQSDCFGIIWLEKMLLCHFFNRVFCVMMINNYHQRADISRGALN